MFLFTIFNFILFGLLIAFFLWKKNQKFYFSIRWKFLVLVIFSAGIPFLMLAFTVRDYMDESRQRLIENGKEAAIQQLQEFDESFLSMKEFLQRDLLELMTRKGFPRNPDPDSLKQALRPFLHQRQVFSLSLIASFGPTLTLYKKGSQTPSWSGFLQELGRRVLERLNGGSGSQGSQTVDWDAVLAKDFALSLKANVDEAAAHLGKLFEIRVGESSYYTLMAPFQGNGDTTDFLLTFAWRKADLARAYFQHSLRQRPDADGHQIIAFTPETLARLEAGKASDSSSRLYFPPTSRFAPPVLLPAGFFPEKKGTSTFHRFFQETDPDRAGFYLVSGMPAKRLEPCYLLYFKPLAQQIAEIEGLQWKFFLFAVTNILLVLGFGHFLARRILSPIKELSEGLNSVKVKRLGFRISPQEADELGDLTVLFNTMMESHQQMAVASQVQRELFPKNMLEVANYRIFGLSWPATELGGDYLDYLPVGNENLIVLIADVTGHGVSAALIMAMSKAMVNHLSRGNAYPLQILESLNQVLFETVRKTRLVSLGFLWVNTSTDEATFFNCGHLYPAIRRLNGDLSFVQSNGVVLGRLPRVKTTPVNFVLMPGERLIFYTDGMIESFINAGSAEPHEDFKTYLKNRPFLPIEKACADLLENLPTVRAREPQPDDFSVVMVDRVK